MVEGIVVKLPGVAFRPVAFRAFQTRVSFTIIDMAFIALVLTGTVLSLAYRDDSGVTWPETILAGLAVSAIAIVLLFLHRCTA
jgi:hypothetical protein